MKEKETEHKNMTDLSNMTCYFCSFMHWIVQRDLQGGPAVFQMDTKSGLLDETLGISLDVL